MHTRTFEELTAGQVSELIDLFSDSCHHWDKVRGFAKVDFDSEEEAETFVQNHVFSD